MKLDFTVNMQDPRKVVMDAMIAQEMGKGGEFYLLVSQFMGELLYYSWRDEKMDEHREAYLDEEVKEKVRSLGEKINEMGGFRLMQFLAEASHPMMRHRSDMRILDFAWDGIGDWRC